MKGGLVNSNEKRELRRPEEVRKQNNQKNREEREKTQTKTTQTKQPQKYTLHTTHTKTTNNTNIHGTHEKQQTGLQPNPNKQSTENTCTKQHTHAPNKQTHAPLIPIQTDTKTYITQK